jgi:hypothetical protein
MVEIGKKYEITMCQPTHDSYDAVQYPHWTVKAVSGSVVAFERDGEEWIVNLASPLFGYAEPQR